MKVGAERKKVLVLVGLTCVAGYLLYQQFLAGPSPSAAPPVRTAQPARAIRSAADEILDGRAASKTKPSQGANLSFRPTLKRSKPGEGPDPVKLDPTLRTDLLARVHEVEFSGANRNLFLFGAAKPKPLTPKQEEAAKLAAQQPAKPAETGPPPEPPKPTAPPITMKYFGYVSRPGDARKRAFLMDGEEILVAVEGEVVKKKYKIVRIGVNSIIMEDMDFKSQQTLPLQEIS